MEQTTNCEILRTMQTATRIKKTMVRITEFPHVPTNQRSNYLVSSLIELTI